MFCVSEEKFRFVKVAAARPSGGELGRMALTGSPKLASLKLQSKDETGKREIIFKLLIFFFFSFKRCRAPVKRNDHPIIEQGVASGIYMCRRPSSGKIPR